jgi:hypothetical protein
MVGTRSFPTGSSIWQIGMASYTAAIRVHDFSDGNFSVHVILFGIAWGRGYPLCLSSLAGFFFSWLLGHLLYWRVVLHRGVNEYLPRCFAVAPAHKLAWHAGAAREMGRPYAVQGSDPESRVRRRGRRACFVGAQTENARKNPASPKLSAFAVAQFLGTHSFIFQCRSEARVVSGQFPSHEKPRGQ